MIKGEVELTGKSCFNCIHSKHKRYPGTHGTRLEPPEPPAAGCSHPNGWIEDAYKAAEEANSSSGLELYQLIAENCSLYWPEKVGHCVSCREYTNEPLYDWKIWARAWALVPVCSEECRREVENRLEGYVEEQKKL